MFLKILRIKNASLVFNILFIPGRLLHKFSYQTVITEGYFNLKKIKKSDQ